MIERQTTPYYQSCRRRAGIIARARPKRAIHQSEKRNPGRPLCVCAHNVYDVSVAREPHVNPPNRLLASATRRRIHILLFYMSHTGCLTACVCVPGNNVV